jgi:hypothetical protein
MSVIADYKEIIGGSYFKPENLAGLKTNLIPTQINALERELRQLAEKNGAVIQAALKLMTELSIYKRALEMEIRANQIPDAKVPERVYVQVRGAIPISKGKRIWVGHYLGKREEVCNSSGQVLPVKMCEGREAVIQKVVDRYLQEQLG